tara:strand:+ start:433 stop:615 length:183 start_codon:yes stop_codon:yes gene_type:complete
MNDTTGKKIQRIRIERSHTQVELAHRIRETLDTINKIETGKMEVNRYILEKIQNYFKVKL